jgi:hypothetical protein
MYAVVDVQVVCLVPPIHAEASLSVMGAKAKAWGLLIHAEASLSVSLSVNYNPSLGNKPFYEHANHVEGPGRYCWSRLGMPCCSRNVSPKCVA